MKKLVTGGTGFIGRSLISKLLKEGDKVTILTRDERKLENSFRGKVEVLETDLGHSTLLGRLSPILQSVDTIFHLAASSNYFGDRRDLYNPNVKGTVNLLNWAEKNSIKKFVFTSSIEAMGLVKKEEIPADETYKCKPVSPYGKSKSQAEMQVKEFAAQNGLGTVIVRLGNVYGPGSPNFILPIVDAISKTTKLRQFLPFYHDRYLHPVFIEDAVNGIIQAAESGRSSETYIIAGNEYVTIEVLFEQIAEVINTKMKENKDYNLFMRGYIYFRQNIHRLQHRADLMDYLTAGKGKRVHRAYSIEKARKELNYSPKMKLKEGIKETYDWLKKEGYLSS